MIRDILKSIRAIRAINIPIRWGVLVLAQFARRAHAVFNKHWPAVGIIRVALPGGEELKLKSDGDDWISTQLFWKGLGGYEGKSELLFYFLAQSAEVVVDIGANIGFYSILAGLANRRGRIYSFEPAQAAHSRLLQNIGLNHLHNVLAESLVVSADSNPIKFYIPDGKEIGQVLAASTKKGWATHAKEVTLPSVSLDEYKKSQSISRINLIKMDCEFHELEVLRGMQTILRDDRPLILMEVLFRESTGVAGHYDYSQSDAIEQLMKSYGYGFYLISESALIRTDHLEHNPENRNYLFSTYISSNRFIPYSQLSPFLAPRNDSLQQSVAPPPK